MGRTIPSFRIAGAMEESKWRPFRALLNKKHRKQFDDMLHLPSVVLKGTHFSIPSVSFGVGLFKRGSF